MSQQPIAYRLFVFLLLVGVILPLASSCSGVNPDEGIPSYVHVADVQVQTNVSTEGSASANISELWLFVEDAFLGAYDIPSTIPVLASGNTTLRFEVGIRDNGISATPEIYPFYTPFSRQTGLEPMQTDTFQVIVRYREETQFALIENYENGLTVFQDLISGASYNRLRASEGAAFQGNMGGLIELNSEFPVAELASTRRFTGLQDNGFPVYLEMDFRSEAPVQFGIVGYARGSEIPIDIQYVAGFNPSDEWKKIYFNFSQAIANSTAQEFKLILQTSLPTQNDGTYSSNSAQVRIDNLKLLHF